MKISQLCDKWNFYYEKSLYNFNIIEAMAIAKYYRPQKIYKYCDFESEHWRENLFDYKIPFNLPSSFNDPLDSRWFLDYEQILKDRFHDIGEEWSKEQFWKSDIQLFEEDMLYLRYMFLISCFSTTVISNLMWGHYANKHKGFCIEYDTSFLPKDYSLLLPVVYTDLPFDASKIIDMRGIDDKYATICPYLFKSNDWKYEKEWRIFINYKEEYEVPHIASIPKSISGIYLGINSYNESIKEVEEWADKQQIPVYQMERTYFSYDLTYDLLTDIRSGKSRKGLLI